MLDQINIYGKDKVETAIEWLQRFEPPGGYYLAFSGGKDSVVVKKLCDLAGVKYDAEYTLTTVDPPELVNFVKSFNDVTIRRPKDRNGNYITMWNLIPRKKMPPTRIVRYCCSELKESASLHRFTVTGVRKAESARRKANAEGLEVSATKTGRRQRYDPDNPNEDLLHVCQKKAQRHLNPIIDWSDADVWDFIERYNVDYCKLYDEGFKRLGCIGCPMAGRENRIEQFERWPTYKSSYIKAFEKMLAEREKAGLKTDTWKTGEEVLEWWLKE